ncbi:MAG: type II toxin-antitoxin system HicB family antitoxin [marine benthic group bacterium]|nr:type II toxin-antitoxin system HicB family antitoxin [Gemmatimonadota bacterium]
MEATSTGYSAYSPDLPGCIATGSTESDVEQRMRQAIQLHVAGLREQGEPVPEPQSSSSYVEVSA